MLVLKLLTVPVTSLTMYGTVFVEPEGTICPLCSGRSAELGAWLLDQLRQLHHPHIREIRGRGLLIGIELSVKARTYCERLKDLGLLCKETHDCVIRLAPPLIISREDLAWMLQQLQAAFA